MSECLTYVNGELITKYNNCYEVCFTLEQNTENNDPTMFFYSYDYGYNIHYAIDTNFIEVIEPEVENQLLKQHLDSYWDYDLIRTLQIYTENHSYDEIIHTILACMDSFNLFLSELKESELKNV